MTIKDRIQQYIDYKGISIYRLEANAELSKGYWAKTKSISADVAMKISRLYTDISAEWLLRGEGEMLKNEITEPESLPSIEPTNITTERLFSVIESQQRTIENLSKK